MGDPSGAPSDLFAKLMASPSPSRPRKRKAQSPGATRIGKKHRQFIFGGASGGGAASGGASGGYEFDDEVEEEANRSLPLLVSTLAAGDSPPEAWNVVSTKCVFFARGNIFRASYWVYHRGHCVARAMVWNNEFDDVRYEHHGFGFGFAAATAALAAAGSSSGAPSAAGMTAASTSPTAAMTTSAASTGTSTSNVGLNKMGVSHISTGLMAILDALAFTSSCSYAAFVPHWRVYVDNVDALKLVDMYQRNFQFLKFHAERPLLDLVMELARQQAGRILLFRK